MTSTPARLRAALTVLLLGLMVLWVVVLALLRQQSQTIDEVTGTDAARLAHAIALSTRLADVDATATRSFLEPGPGSVEVRDRYVQGLELAGAELATIGALAGADPGLRAAVTTLDESLPAYAGLVETGRADERQGLVVGAAYLRQGSQLMRSIILPAAADVYTRAAMALDGDADRGTGARSRLTVVAVTAGLVLALVAVQSLLAAVTHRTLNIGLLVATVAVLVVGTSTALVLAASSRSIDRAERDGSDAVQLLAAVRILALRAHSDSNLALIERGTGQDFLDDAARIDAIVRGDGTAGLLAEARRRSLPQHRASVTAIAEQYGDLVRTGDAIARRSDAGSYDEAIAMALGEQADVAGRLDERLATTIDAHQASFERHAGGAGRGLVAVAIVATIGALAAAVAIVVGLRPRIGEYR